MVGVSACHERKEKKNENNCERNFKEDFPKNCLGELSNSSSRRLTHDCFRELPSKFPSEDCPIYLLKLGSKFSRTKTFCFENCIFARIWLRHV